MADSETLDQSEIDALLRGEEPSPAAPPITAQSATTPSDEGADDHTLTQEELDLFVRILRMRGINIQILSPWKNSA